MQTPKKPNKSITPKRRSRNPNGQPRAYQDGNRWKAPGSFIDGLGQKHNVMGTGSNPETANKQLAINLEKKKAELSLAQLPKDQVMVGQFCTKWLQEKIATSFLAPKTQIGYQSALKNWIVPFIGHLQLPELTKSHIDELFMEITRRGYSRSTQVQVRAVLKQALDEAVDNEFIDKTPLRNVKMQKRRPSRPTYFKPMECRSILEAVQTKPQALRMQLALIYGLRQGEALGLTWSNVELSSKHPQIQITQQLQRQSSKGLVLRSLKTSSSFRSIPLTKETSDLFKEVLELNELARSVQGPSWNPDGFVFTSSTGTAIDPANDRKGWLKTLDQAGVRRLPLHAARHTAATLGGDLNVASKLLGHSSLEVTADFYAAVPLEPMLASLESVQSKIKSS